MNRYGRALGRSLGFTLWFVLAACGEQRKLPGPPGSPPKPVTSAGASIITAQYIVTVRPHAPAPGMM